MKDLSRKLYGAAMALAVGVSATSALAQATNLVYLTDFETNPDTGSTLGRPNYTYGYQYGWGYPDPAPQPQYTQDTSFMEPPDYTNTLYHFTFDNAAMTPEPSGAGYGVGFGGGLKWATDATVMASTNRADYIFEFDAKVEGLLPGQATGNAQMQVRFDAPDDTIQPPDSDTSADTLLQVNIDFNPGSNWTHYVYTLDQGGIGGGSEKNFATYLSSISEPRFGVNLHQPDAQFGFDSDNGVFIDNMKLSVMIISNPPALPEVGLPICDWNMDDKGLWYAWAGGGWSENTQTATYSVDRAMAAQGWAEVMPTS